MPSPKWWRLPEIWDIYKVYYFKNKTIDDLNVTKLSSFGNQCHKTILNFQAIVDNLIGGQYETFETNCFEQITMTAQLKGLGYCHILRCIHPVHAGTSRRI